MCWRPRAIAADALSGMELLGWDTQEVLAFIEWIRAWNIVHERKVKFHASTCRETGAKAAQHRRCGCSTTLRASRTNWPRNPNPF